MKVDIVMPKMGESINEGTIIKWYKKKGEEVKKDEIIFEISTDKVDTEIPCPDDGILYDIKAFEQETVDVGSVVAILETDKKSVAVEESEPVEETPSTTQVGGALVEVVMPKMGESVMEGTIIKWHKAIGDAIAMDEIIFEISTDKVDTEVPSPVEGTLAEIITAENETVEVGVVVAKISSLGGIVQSSPNQPKVEEQKEIVEEKPSEDNLSVTPVAPAKIVSNRFYSPLVLNIARVENISFDELETIPGSGVGGRLTKKDILNYLKDGRKNQYSTQSQSTYTPDTSAPVKSYSSGDGVEVIPMDNIRQRIKQHMINSRDTSVHVTAVVEVDMTKIYKYIQKNKNEFLASEGFKLTYMPFISHSCIKGLKEFPLMNASLRGDEILQKKFVNLGIAVAIEPNGLIVPNIKAADDKSIRGLAKSITELGAKARNKGLLPDDIVNGTFTITNYGVFGSLFGTPIINQPEVAILGVGSVVKKPVVVEVNGDDTIAIKPMMYLSLSHDHRLVDGMLGGKFLQSVKNRLENFDTKIL